MGAWETDITSNDTVQDFFLDIEDIIGIEDLSVLITEKDFGEIKNNFLEKRSDILTAALNDEAEVTLAYIGLLKMMSIEVNEDEKAYFEKALHYEYDEANSWSEPELRKSYLKALEIAVNENTAYDFSMKK